MILYISENIEKKLDEAAQKESVLTENEKMVRKKMLPSRPGLEF